MHDSNLDVNTWIASDNVTQLHTIDLNSGTVSPTAEAGELTPSNGEPGETPVAGESDDEQSPDEDEEGTTSGEDDSNDEEEEE